MKNKKLLSKILGMTMLLVMLLVPALNVSASSSGGPIAISIDGTYLETLEFVGENTKGVTLDAMDLTNKTGEITLDENLELNELFATYKVTININGDNKIEKITENNNYVIKGEGTLTITSLEYSETNDEGITEWKTKPVTEDWLSEHIETELNASVNDEGILVITSEGRGDVTPEEPEEPTESEEYKLTAEDIEFISDEPLGENLTLEKTDYLELLELIEDEEYKDYLKGQIAEIEELFGKKIVGFYDINVFDEYQNIVPMEDGNFKIRIKLTDEMKEYDYLVAAYVDKDNDEDIEYFGVTIEDDYLTFNTTHLSTYVILGDNIKNIDNPNTGDHIGLYLIITLLGTTGLLISYKSMKNMA